MTENAAPSVIVPDVLQLNLSLRRMCFEGCILPLNFPQVLHCKGEALVHLTWLNQHCTVDIAHTAAVGCASSLVGRVVELAPDIGRERRVECILWL